MNLSIDFLFAALIAVILIVALLLYVAVYLKPPETVTIRSSLILSRLVLDPLFNKYVRNLVSYYTQWGRVPKEVVYDIEALANSYIGNKYYCMIIYLHSCIILYARPIRVKYNIDLARISNKKCGNIIGIASQEGMFVTFYNELYGTYELCNVTILLKVS